MAACPMGWPGHAALRNIPDFAGGETVAAIRATVRTNAAMSATVRAGGRGNVVHCHGQKAARRAAVEPDWRVAGSLRGDAGRADRKRLKSHSKAAKRLQKAPNVPTIDDGQRCAPGPPVQVAHRRRDRSS